MPDITRPRLCFDLPPFVVSSPLLLTALPLRFFTEQAFTHPFSAGPVDRIVVGAGLPNRHPGRSYKATKSHHEVLDDITASGVGPGACVDGEQ